MGHTEHIKCKRRGFINVNIYLWIDWYQSCLTVCFLRTHFGNKEHFKLLVKQTNIEKLFGQLEGGVNTRQKCSAISNTCSTLPSHISKFRVSLDVICIKNGSLKPFFAYRRKWPGNQHLSPDLHAQKLSKEEGGTFCSARFVLSLAK